MVEAVAAGGGPAGGEPAGLALYRRVAIVANPIAGRGRGEAIGAAIERGLRERGARAHLHLTRGRGDGTAHVRGLETRPDAIVCVGGDGTLREVLEGLPDPALPVVPVPLGTANVMARELGLPRDAQAALATLAAGREQALDVARVDGRLSMLVTGVGLDAEIVRSLEARRRGPITRAHYLAATLRVLPGYRPPRLRVAVDDRALEGTFGLVLASNAPSYAGLLRLAEDARIDDGRFEVYAVRDARPAALVGALARGTLVGLASCEVHRVRRLRVESDEPVPYQVDGDLAGETPVAFAVEDQQYRLIVPRTTPEPGP